MWNLLKEKESSYEDLIRDLYISVCLSSEGMLISIVWITFTLIIKGRCGRFRKFGGAFSAQLCCSLAETWPPQYTGCFETAAVHKYSIQLCMFSIICQTGNKCTQCIPAAMTEAGGRTIKSHPYRLLSLFPPVPSGISSRPGVYTCVCTSVMSIGLFVFLHVCMGFHVDANLHVCMCV